jgi:hypothetical protein
MALNEDLARMANALEEIAGILRVYCCSCDQIKWDPSWPNGLCAVHGAVARTSEGILVNPHTGERITREAWVA